MAQQPAVVIVARHGPRLDAADQSWHLSTPTPYDPPLTYGGWNQSRALGTRIASLLHQREQQAANESSVAEGQGITAHDFATPPQDGAATGKAASGSRKRKRKHKVVIHTSPFLRCLQTSVAISAGMAQFQPPELANSRPSSSSKGKAMHSGSPHLRGHEALGSPSLAPISEPKHDFAHAIARRSLGQHSKRHRKAKLRVDSFLGEWLNPQYFDQITPPPPSAMMVATAKAELMQNQNIDIFSPSMPTKPVNHSLWGGSGSDHKAHSRESSLDDFGEMRASLPQAPSSPRRDRTSSFGSEGTSGRRSSFGNRYLGRHRTSSIPKPETSVYVPPTPQYAVSSSDYIPRGYVSHARQACANVDYQWDSSRAPQDWGDGGELGEEWSQLHKRFRRGFNNLIQWYSQHNVDDRAEDSLGIDQAEKHEDEEEEDLVVILVTHGAGCNALIGALTGQPVLLDVGMASLTLAVRKDDAPPITTYASSTLPSADGTPRASPSPEQQQLNGGGNHARRGSLDLGLSSVYEMKLVSSSEHLRPGANPSKTTTVASVGSPKSATTTTQYRQRMATVSLGEPASAVSTARSTNSSLGSMRRPSVASLSGRNTSPAVPQLDTVEGSASMASGLWTPPGARTPRMDAAKAAEDAKVAELKTLEHDERKGRDSAVVDSRKEAAQQTLQGVTSGLAKGAPLQQPSSRASAMTMALHGQLDGPAVDSRSPSQSPPPPMGDVNKTPARTGSITGLPTVEQKPPETLGRTLSQKGLWGSRPAGDKVKRTWTGNPKRRWTVTQEDNAGK